VREEVKADRMPYNSRNEGSQRTAKTLRGISAAALPGVQGVEPVHVLLVVDRAQHTLLVDVRRYAGPGHEFPCQLDLSVRHFISANAPGGARPAPSGDRGREATTPKTLKLS